jgi:hypothetical protein
VIIAGVVEELRSVKSLVVVIGWGNSTGPDHSPVPGSEAIHPEGIMSELLQPIKWLFSTMG